MATVLGSCPFLPRLLGCQGGGSRCTALITAQVNSPMKLRFTWFATVGFIRCFAHPISQKIELYLLVIYFGMKPLLRICFYRRNCYKISEWRQRGLIGLGEMFGL